MSVQSRWYGDAVKDAMRAALIIGLNAAAEQLLASAQALVPVDTGDLRRSGTYHPAVDGELVARVTFNTHYAVEQHENLGFYHPKEKNPLAQAKFLETPLRRDAALLLKLINAHVARSMGA